MKHNTTRRRFLILSFVIMLLISLSSNTLVAAIDVDVAKAIADKLGVEADFTESDWDSLLAGIDSGRLDTVINAVSITDEREEKYDFAGPYFYITQQIVVAKDNDDIVDMASLDGKKMANTATTAYLDLLEDAGVSLVQISTADEAVSLISSGRADFTTFNSVVFNEYLKQHPDANLKVAFVIPDVQDEYGVPVKKGETALYDAIQNAIDELKEDGTLSQLSMDYFDTDFTQPEDAATDSSKADSDTTDSDDSTTTDSSNSDAEASDSDAE